MPPGVRSLRAMLHATAVEVLLYLTPLHCHDMLCSLVEAMNAQFSKFMLRHPDFQVSTGGVSQELSSIPSPAQQRKSCVLASLLGTTGAPFLKVFLRCPDVRSAIRHVLQAGMCLILLL